MVRGQGTSPCLTPPRPRGSTVDSRVDGRRGTHTSSLREEDRNQESEPGSDVKVLLSFLRWTVGALSVLNVCVCQSLPPPGVAPRPPTVDEMTPRSPVWRGSSTVTRSPHSFFVGPNDSYFARSVVVSSTFPTPSLSDRRDVPRLPSCLCGCSGAPNIRFASPFDRSLPEIRDKTTP